MSELDGGPAFPVPDSEYVSQDRGMTLRDYFAAKVLQATISNEEWNHWTTAQHAEYAFGAADEMLRARGQ